MQALERQCGTTNSYRATQEAYDRIVSRDPDQKEFLQAVEEVFTSLAPVIEKHPEYAAVLERIAEPERQLAFRVPWFDDKGNLQHNRGYRVQMNSALGPYKVCKTVSWHYNVMSLHMVSMMTCSLITQDAHTNITDQSGIFFSASAAAIGDIC